MWQTLTPSGLRDRLSTEEIDTLTAEAIDPDIKVRNVLMQISEDVVAHVNTGRRTRGLRPIAITTPTIPPGAVRHAYTLARRLLTDAFPSLAEYNGEDRKIACEVAEGYLTDLAKNNIDSDDTGADVVDPPVTTTGASIRYGGSALMDFNTQP